MATSLCLGDAPYTLYAFDHIPLSGAMPDLVLWSDGAGVLVKIPEGKHPDDYTVPNGDGSYGPDSFDYRGAGQWRRITLVQINGEWFEVGAGDWLPKSEDDDDE